MSRVLVTGATGFVGQAFMSALSARADAPELVAFGRRAPAGVAHWVRGDLTAPETLHGLDGVHTVVHIAAEKRDAAAMYATNVEGTRALLRAARAARARRFVLLSSVGVYGAPPGSGRVTESFAHAPANEYERTKDLAEREVLASCRDAGIQCIVLQPSNVIGVSGDGARPLLSLMRNVKAGRVVRFSRRAQANYVAVRDVANALVLAALTDSLEGTFIVNEPMPLDAFLASVAEAVGREAPWLRVPSWVGHAAGVVGSMAERTLGRPAPINRTRVRELTNTTWYDASAWARATGSGCAHGVAAAITELADSYAAAGLL
jgi:dihydroflavonol-4-reductase